jgi:hypothetical protein
LLGDEMVVTYEWHPWTGRSVRVHKVIETTQGAAARCDLADTQTIRFLEIPVWMLDPVACRSMRAAAQPVAALSALTSLRAFLSEAMAHAAASSSGEAVGSRDHHRGDRHAASPSSAPDAEPSTRPLSVQPATDAGNDVGMEYPAGSNPAGADRAVVSESWWKFAFGVAPEVDGCSIKRRGQAAVRSVSSSQCG